MRLSSVWPAAVVSLVLAGCGNDAGSPATTGSPSTTTPSTSPVDNKMRPPIDPQNPFAFEMAFDVSDSVVVAAAGNETWVLDVSVDQWTQMEAPAPPTDLGHSLFYSAELGDVIDLTGNGSVWSYDVATDEWQRLSGPDGDGRWMRGMAEVDATSGDLIVVGDGPVPQAWRIELPSGTWTQLEPGDVPFADNAPGGPIMVYDPVAGGFVVIDYRAGETLIDATYLYVPETGEWTPRAGVPRLGFGYFPFGREAAFASKTGRSVFVTLGVAAEYDARSDTWSLFMNGELAADATSWAGVPRTQGSAVVDDPVNGRLLMYGGVTWIKADEDWHAVNSLWAYDPATHQWTEVLPATETPSS
jgi:Kelch motif